MVSAIKSSECAEVRTSQESASSHIRYRFDPSDVVFGRGSTIGKYLGNHNFRRICWEYKPFYLKAYRHEKQRVASQVIETIMNLDPPGRFIEQVAGEEIFESVTYERALEKTCQYLREKKCKKPDGTKPRAQELVNTCQAKPRSSIPVQPRPPRKVQSKGIAYKDDGSDVDDEEKKPMPVKSSKVPQKKSKVVSKSSSPKAKTSNLRSSKKRVVHKVKISKCKKKAAKGKYRKTRAAKSDLDLKLKEDPVIVKSEEIQAESLLTGSPIFERAVLTCPRLITPYPGLDFEDPIAEFDEESRLLPDFPIDDDASHSSAPLPIPELFRGLSDFSYRGIDLGQTPSGSDEDFDMELENIPEPPLSLRATSSWSAHSGFIRSFYDRKSPNGVFEFPEMDHTKSGFDFLADEDEKDFDRDCTSLIHCAKNTAIGAISKHTLSN